MSVEIEIDGKSGFCPGVVRAVERAETYLKNHDRLYSLGDIVHNSLELERLKKNGLEILSMERLKDLEDAVVLIRAHGEPPSTYKLAKTNNLEIIDCTCPVVLKLQEKVRMVYEEMAPKGGQIVIFGKRGHAEVNGLVGQTGGNAIVVDSIDSAAQAVDFRRPVALFSQTTKDPVEYAAVADYLRSCAADVTVFDTICRQVAQRHGHLAEFAKKHSVVLFVSGKESSNGKVLFELCKSVNSRTYWLEAESQIDCEWFHDGDFVGICGATSTPKWQLEEIFVYLQDKLNNINK